MTKLHVFDMDGTLLRGTSVEEISRYLGRFEEAHAFEQAYLTGEVADVDGPLWWKQVLDLWAEASEQELDAAFDHAPWMQRIPEVFADIAGRGEHSVVISQSPLFIVQRLERWGAEATFATTVERGVPCYHDQILSSQDKVEITMRLLAELGLAASDCVAYGDSSSDVDLFRVLDRTVGVNADSVIRSMAAETHDGADLWDAYQIGRLLLAREEFRNSHPMADCQ
jgi:phosphoserine phosphatase